MRSQRGLTVLELVFALVVVFGASLSILGLVLNGLRFHLRGKDYSTAILLAQSKTERLASAGVDSVSPGTGRFEAPYQEYQYQLDVTDLDDKCKVVQVTAISPGGPRATMTLLKNTVGVGGVDCDPFTTLVDYRSSASQVTRLEDASGLENAALPALPAAGTVQGLASLVDGSGIWVVDGKNNGLRYLDTATPAWTAPLAPAGVGRLRGLAAEDTNQLLFVGDTQRKALWIYSDLPVRNGAWTGPFRPPDGSLGTPGSLATDGYGSQVWVADLTSKALRVYRVHTNTWDPRLYAAPGMGVPRGVALNPGGDLVYVVDQSRLYIYDPVADSWRSDPLPGDLSQAGPLGLAADLGGDVVWLVTANGQLWKFLATPSTFVRRP